MSNGEKVQRYSESRYDGLQWDDSGDYVEYDDYAKMESLLDDYERLCQSKDAELIELRALASQPAAPAHPMSIEAIRKLALDMCATDAEGHSEEFNDGRAYGVAKMNAALMKLAAPPVQQPGDVRDTNGTIDGGDVSFNQVFVTMDEKPSPELWTLGNRCYLATTRPSAALTEAQRNQIIQSSIADWPAGFKDTPYKAMDQIITKAERAILAASSGAVAVPEDEREVWIAYNSADDDEAVMFFTELPGSELKERFVLKHYLCRPAAPAIPDQGQTK